MRIRPYEEQDKAAIIKLVDESLLAVFGTPGRGLEDLEDIPAQYGSGVFFVAEDGVLAGTIAVVPEGEGRWRLKRMYVRKDFRGKGLAARLLERAERFAKERGARVIVLNTYPQMVEANAFYRKHKYHQVAGGDGIAYEKEL